MRATALTVRDSPDCSGQPWAGAEHGRGGRTQPYMPGSSNPLRGGTTPCPLTPCPVAPCPTDPRSDSVPARRGQLGASGRGRGGPRPAWRAQHGGLAATRWRLKGKGAAKPGRVSGAGRHRDRPGGVPGTAPGLVGRGPGDGTGTGREGSRGRWGPSQSPSPAGAAGTGPVSGCSVHRWRQRRWQQRGQSTGPERRRQRRQGERVGRRGPGGVRVLCPSTWRLVPPAGPALHSPAALTSGSAHPV